MVDAHSPLDFDNPHSVPPEKPLYHPYMIAWLVVDIPYILRRWCWQKCQSLAASRKTITFEAVTALRNLESIEDGEDLPRATQEDARVAKERLVRICEELNIEDSRINRYAEESGGNGS